MRRISTVMVWSEEDVCGRSSNMIPSLPHSNGGVTCLKIPTGCSTSASSRGPYTTQPVPMRARIPRT